MQKECARELKAGGWHWVGSHTPDCRVRKCEPHGSKTEAETCQYESELATATTKTFSTARECRACKASGTDGVWTPTAMQRGGYLGDRVFLCEVHRTTEMLRRFTNRTEERWVS